MSFQNFIEEHLSRSADTKLSIGKQYGKDIERIARQLAHCLANGGKVLTCGNGGSASDSEHIAAEFVGRFRRERRSLAAISLTVPGSLITAIGNDYGYDQVFSRQVEGQGNPGDILFGFSTSGNSKNVIAAARTARRKGMLTVGFSGRGGGALASEVDISICISSDVTAHIQECHITVGHIICEIADELLETMLGDEVAESGRKLVSLEELVGLREKWRQQNKTVVWTNGCFDLLHNGHVRNLQDAKRQGDVLVVGVNSDLSVKNNKGPKRPIQNEQDRAEMVAALAAVDLVTIFNEKTPISVLSALKPDIHCKGADYAFGAKPMEEMATVESYGGKIAFLELHPGYSTTSLVERIQNEVQEKTL